MTSGRALLLGALIGSVAVTLVAVLVFRVYFLFLFLPILPFLFRSHSRVREVKRCTSCNWYTDDMNYNFCPCDGTPLTYEQPVNEVR
jgi:hypothetical protein